MAGKIWANSGDSHLVEPDDLFTSRLPAELAARMARSDKDPNGKWETLHVDGQEFRRRMPARDLTDPETGLTVDERTPGANDAHLRLKDLDADGIWAELIYPSIGIWTSSIEDPVLLQRGSSTTARRWRPPPPWAGPTSAGAAITPTSKARMGTPRRRCTSCSTM